MKSKQILGMRSSMVNKNKEIVLAFFCNDKGDIEKFLGPSKNIDGENILSIYDLALETEKSKLNNFLIKVKNEEIVYCWEINAQLQGKIFSLCLVGALVENRILVIGSNKSSFVMNWYEELMKMCNDHVTSIRMLMKQIKEEAEEKKRNETNYLNEFSKLNSELVNTQREIIKKNKELQKLHALKNDFIGMISHDLRTPLNAISLYSEFLIDEVSNILDDSQKEFLLNIKTSSSLMVNLVDELLSVSKIENSKAHLKLNYENLAEIINKTLILIRPTALKKDIIINTNYSTNLPKTMVDGQKIQQVLNNVLSNAIKFSYNHKEVFINLFRKKENLVIEIEDQGQGISPEGMQKLFVPFGDIGTKPTQGESSTGLGLVIIKKIVEEHQGRVYVESTLGKGTKFTIILPIIEQEIIEEPQRVVVEQGKKNLNILVAEDNIINQKIMLKLLSQNGHNVIIAANGLEAIKAYGENDIDTILMDLEMPQMDGIEATKIIKTKETYIKKPIPIIAMTGHDLSMDVDKFKESGMDDYLVKPINYQELLTKIR